MHIIISPAKKMRQDNDTFAHEDLPLFLSKTESLMRYIQSLDYDACKRLWQCNDAIAAQNYERFSSMDLQHNLTPALFAYDGIQYQYMAPNVFTNEELSYIRQHLRILSGFYGILRPFDGVCSYRLEMQAKPTNFSCKSLYEYWGTSLADALAEESRCILNLASKEYSKAVQPHIPSSVRWVDCTFAELVNGKAKEKGTFAKMARGAMVRHAAQTRAETPEALLDFHCFGFAYSKEYSNENHLVFLKGD